MSDIIGPSTAKIGQIPEKLVELLREEYPHEHGRILAGFSAFRNVTLRANTLKTSADEVARTLEEAGICFKQVPWYRDAFVIENAGEDRLRELPLYERGEVYLQSLSSMLPPLLIKPKAGERILDMAAAPGGKTTQLLALSGGAALITACEKDAGRFSRLQYNLQKQGAGRVNAMRTDASALDPFFRFDKILLDAPCSGSGTVTLSRPVKFSEALLKGCMRSQEKLLLKGLSLLKQGGLLVYSTCSVLKEENERLLERVLPRFSCTLEEPDAPFLRGELAPSLLTGAARTLTVCPDGLFEGFFLAAIRKN